MANWLTFPNEKKIKSNFGENDFFEIQILFYAHSTANWVKFGEMKIFDCLPSNRAISSFYVGKTHCKMNYSPCISDFWTKIVSVLLVAEKLWTCPKVETAVQISTLKNFLLRKNARSCSISSANPNCYLIG